MRDDAQLVDRLETPLSVYTMEDTVGKGKELFVGFPTQTIALLVSVGLDLRAHHEMAAHIGLDGFPLPFLAIEVHRLVVDEHLFYR